MQRSAQYVKTDKYIDEFCRGRGLEIGGAGNYIEGLDSIKADNKDEYVGRKYDIDTRLDGTDLGSFEDDSLDYVVSIHVLEHIANPLKALVEWHRVVRPGGFLFTAVPQRKYTFDRYRTTTTIQHLLDDYYRNVPPSDTTHLEEFGRYAAPMIYLQRKKPKLATRRVVTGLIRSYRGKGSLRLTAKQQQLAAQIDKDTCFQRQAAECGVAVDIHHHVWANQRDVLSMTEVLGMEPVKTLEGYLGNSILFVIKVGEDDAAYRAGLRALREGIYPEWVEGRSSAQETFRRPTPLDTCLYSPRLQKLWSTLVEQGALAAIGTIGASIRRRSGKRADGHAS